MFWCVEALTLPLVRRGCIEAATHRDTIRSIPARGIDESLKIETFSRMACPLPRTVAQTHRLWDGWGEPPASPVDCGHPWRGEHANQRLPMSGHGDNETVWILPTPPSDVPSNQRAMEPPWARNDEATTNDTTAGMLISVSSALQHSSVPSCVRRATSVREVRAATRSAPARSSALGDDWTRPGPSRQCFSNQSSLSSASRRLEDPPNKRDGQNRRDARDNAKGREGGLAAAPRGGAEGKRGLRGTKEDPRA